MSSSHSALLAHTLSMYRILLAARYGSTPSKLACPGLGISSNSSAIGPDFANDVPASKDKTYPSVRPRQKYEKNIQSRIWSDSFVKISMPDLRSFGTGP
jgi:hypothetical protein